jgi:hypothetical protein
LIAGPWDISAGASLCDDEPVALTSYESLLAYYSETVRFGEALGAAGYSRTAPAIDNATHGATSGEILTFLALALSRFVADEPDAPHVLRLEADRLRELADQALRVVGQIPPERSRVERPDR